MKDLKKRLGLELSISCIVAGILTIIFVAIEVTCIMFLWNWIAPMFWAKAPCLDFWDTLGFICLFNFLCLAAKQATKAVMGD